MASLWSVAASTPPGGNTDNLTEALSGSDAAVFRSAERRLTASPQGQLKLGNRKCGGAVLTA